MKASVLKLAMLAGILLSLLGFASCSSTSNKQSNATSNQGGLRARIAVEAITMTATVTSIDAVKRTVTLLGPLGNSETYRLGPKVINFDQIRVGDQVKASVVESLAIAVRKAGTPPSGGEQGAVALAPKGAKPGVFMANTMVVTDKITAVDTAKRTVTLEGESGASHTYKVGPNVDLAGLKQGDDVTVRYTEALAILVEAPPAKPLTADEAQAIGTEAYIYGYPLVTMELTRRVMTNVREPEGTRAPMGNLIRMREYPTAAFKDVTAPNADTLYTTTWLDVGKEPWVLSLPDAHGRYYLFPMLDGWTDVFQVPGTRTTGTGPQTYAITGPGWTGTLPDGVTEYKSPTSIIWILGRIYCTGTPEDYEVVHQMQDEISVAPLSSYGKPYTPPPGNVDPSIDMKTPVRDQVNALDAVAYFNLLAKLMKNNPPATADAPMLAKMARLGIVPGQPFDITKLDPSVATALQGVPKMAFEKIMGHFKTAGTFENGWIFATNTGLYGTDYLQRALITAIGLGANRPQDAVYPTSEADATDKSYIGSNKYVMHFDAGQMPPAEAFWSLTMYNAEYFFVENPLNRYTLSSRNEFTTNADGSVDVYLQNDNPGPDKEANWLPAPATRFILMLRLYWPKETPPSILDGTWVIPPVKQAD